jgi:CIC family chloride channel protein
VCGVSAVVSSIFHSPLGGALFAAEITRKNSIIYPHLFPAILTGCAAVYASSLFGQDPVFALSAPPFANRIDHILLCVLAAIISGGVGILFIASFTRMKETFQILPFRQPAQAALAGIILSLIWAAGGLDILGTSIPLFNSLASWDSSALSSIPFYPGNIFLLAALLLILKMTATSITVGSGLSGGVTGPLIVMGACFAALFCAAFGIAGGSAAYFAVLCACISAILSSALNIPIAAALIAVAVFDHSYIIPSVVGAILPFFIFKGKTVFVYPGLEEQLEGTG